MFAVLLTAVVAFVSTNLDDIFVLMLFYAQEDGPEKKSQIMLGQYLGIGALVMLSLLGARLVQLIPRHYIGLLGLVPIALGVKALAEKDEGETDDGLVECADGTRNENWPPKSGATTARGPRRRKRLGGLALSVMLLAIANGADNLGVYIPLFAGYSAGQMLVTAAVFAVMIFLWCRLAQRIAALPALRAGIRKYKRVIVPAVFIALGIFILAENFL